MIRVQVEVHIGSVTNWEAANQAGQNVAFQARKDRTDQPIAIVGGLIYRASDGLLDKKYCVAANETASHRDGTFDIKEARLIGDLLKEHFVDAKTRPHRQGVRHRFLIASNHDFTYTEVVTYQIDPFKWTPRSHGVTTTTHKIPTLRLED